MTEIPMWPKFSLEKSKFDPFTWYVTTCTLRPPVVNGRGQTFTLYFTCEHGPEAAEEVGRLRLLHAYRSAHPNNCAGTEDSEVARDAPVRPLETA